MLYNRSMMNSENTAKAHRAPWLPLQRVLFLIMLVTLLSVVAVGAVGLTYQTAHAQRYYQGVSVYGTQIGGLTRAEAKPLLQEQMAASQMPYIALQGVGQAWTLSLSALGGTFDLDAALAEAWSIGRSGTWQERIRAQARAIWYGYDAAAPVQVSPGLSLEPLRRIARQSALPATSASVDLAGLSVVTQGSQAGYELDIAATRQAIERAVSDALGHSGWGVQPRLLPRDGWFSSTTPLLLAEPVAVPLVFRDVAASLSELADAQARLDALIASPVMLQLEVQELDAEGHLTMTRRHWAIDQATLASWVAIRTGDSAAGPQVEVTLDAARVESFVGELAQAIARPPREGRFLYDEGSQQIEVLDPGQMGLALDLAAAREAILAAAFTADHVITLPVHQAAPLVTAEDLRAMLPLDLIATGESRFAGSTPERAQNIRVASERFHGVTVPAGAEFSFLHYLGPVNASTGYAESWVIFGDQTVLGAGGGVCQVSTTAFRAAFWGGYPITARSEHAYRVDWYEPPLGLDAAVFVPTTDMRFRNDDAWPILIMTRVDEATGTLAFAFYGRSSGREITMVGPTVEGTHQPGDPVEEIDATLPAGTRILAERAREGLDVRIVRIVEQDGEIISEDEFPSRYRAWPARYRVGPSPDTSAP
jgi:vancomycin resistance protein YoaR